jgi:hypothetical protein
MKKAKQQISNIFIVLLVTFFTVACGNTRQNEEQDHGGMMEGEHQMNGDQEMMQDTTSMEIDEHKDEMKQ